MVAGISGLAFLEQYTAKLQRPVLERAMGARMGTADLTRYHDDPIGFIEEWGGALTDQQKRVALSVRDHRTTNVPAAHGLGKTFLGAWLVVWWVFCRHGLAITTAPTTRQVRELLWGEIRNIFDKYEIELGGRRLPREPYMWLTENAKAYGFSAVYYNEDAFQGIHAEKLLIVLDEANGISPAIDDGASSCVTGSGNRMLRIGNPTKTGTPFHDACQHHSIRLACWDHPNVKWAYEIHPDGIHRLKPDVADQILDEHGEVLPQSDWPEGLPRDVVPGAVSIDWIEDKRRKKGENSAYWLGRVEGIFPEGTAQSIITKAMFMAARARYDADPNEWDRLAAKKPSRFGLDVGDGGDDHALARWQGNVLYWVDERQTRGDRQDVSRAAKWAWGELRRHGGICGVDRIGVGSGALSDLLEWKSDPDRQGELPEDVNLVGVNFGENISAGANLINPETDVINIRAMFYWGLREAMRKEEVAIAPLPPGIEEKLIKGFSSIQYDENAKGRVFIEPKAAVKKRLGRSPDLEDAIVMGFGVQVEAKATGMDLLFGAL